MSDARLALAFALMLAFSAAWVLYFRWKDHVRPEPWPMLLAAFAGGAAAVPLALLGYHGFDHLGAPTEWSALVWGGWPEACAQALLIGLVEEAAKLAPVLPIALFSRHFDEPLDGLIYAALSALGFATVETAVQLSSGAAPLWMGLVRAVTGPVSHALFSLPWGWGLARMALSRRRSALVLGFVVSTVLHGSYDLVVARPQLPTPLAPLMVLAVWLWFIRLTPLLAHEHPHTR